MLYGKDRLIELLLKMDEEAALLLDNKGEERYPVVIVGGSAFMLCDLTNRPATHDIDVLSCHEAVEEVLARYRAVNGNVSAYIDQLPYGFEDRLVELSFPTKAIVFLTPSIEDLAIMKLYGWRPNDQEDLEDLVATGRLDWTQMDYLVYFNEESRASALSQRRYEEMVATYELYAKRHGHEPNV